MQLSPLTRWGSCGMVSQMGATARPTCLRGVADMSSTATATLSTGSRARNAFATNAYSSYSLLSFSSTTVSKVRMYTKGMSTPAGVRAFHHFATSPLSSTTVRRMAGAPPQANLKSIANLRLNSSIVEGSRGMATSSNPNGSTGHTTQGGHSSSDYGSNTNSNTNSNSGSNSGSGGGTGSTVEGSGVGIGNVGAGAAAGASSTSNNTTGSNAKGNPNAKEEDDTITSRNTAESHDDTKIGTRKERSNSGFVDMIHRKILESFKGKTKSEVRDAKANGEVSDAPEDEVNEDGENKNDIKNDTDIKKEEKEDVGVIEAIKTKLQVPVSILQDHGQKFSQLVPSESLLTKIFTSFGVDKSTIDNWLKLKNVESLHDLIILIWGSQPDSLYNQARDVMTDTELNPELTKDAHVRVGKNHSQLEREFINSRQDAAVRAISKFIGEEIDPRDLPTIGVAASGGGCRALLCTLGYMNCLKDLGLMPAVTWAAGVSGGTWALAHMYDSKGDFKKLWEDLPPLMSDGYVSFPYLADVIKDDEIRGVVLQGVLEKIYLDKNLTSVDLFGLFLGARFIDKGLVKEVEKRADSISRSRSRSQSVSRRNSVASNDPPSSKEPHLQVNEKDDTDTESIRSMMSVEERDAVDSIYQGLKDAFMKYMVESPPAQKEAEKTSSQPPKISAPDETKDSPASPTPKSILSNTDYLLHQERINKKISRQRSTVDDPNIDLPLPIYTSVCKIIINKEGSVIPDVPITTGGEKYDQPQSRSRQSTVSNEARDISKEILKDSGKISGEKEPEMEDAKKKDKKHTAPKRTVSESFLNEPRPALMNIDAYYQWWEFTPFESGYRDVFLNRFVMVPTWSFGRNFNNGKSTERIPEQNLGLMLATFGSAFTASVAHIYEEVKLSIPVAIRKQILDYAANYLDIHLLSPASYPNISYGMPLYTNAIDRLPLADVRGSSEQEIGLPTAPEQGTPGQKDNLTVPLSRSRDTSSASSTSSIAASHGNDRSDISVAVLDAATQLRRAILNKDGDAESDETAKTTGTKDDVNITDENTIRTVSGLLSSSENPESLIPKEVGLMDSGMENNIPLEPLMNRNADLVLVLDSSQLPYEHLLRLILNEKGDIGSTKYLEKFRNVNGDNEGDHAVDDPNASSQQKENAVDKEIETKTQEEKEMLLKDLKQVRSLIKKEMMKHKKNSREANGEKDADVDEDEDIQEGPVLIRDSTVLYYPLRTRKIRIDKELSKDLANSLRDGYIPADKNSLFSPLPTGKSDDDKEHPALAMPGNFVKTDDGKSPSSQDPASGDKQTPVEIDNDDDDNYLGVDIELSPLEESFCSTVNFDYSESEIRLLKRYTYANMLGVEPKDTTEATKKKKNSHKDSKDGFGGILDKIASELEPEKRYTLLTDANDVNSSLLDRIAKGDDTDLVSQGGPGVQMLRKAIRDAVHSRKRKRLSGKSEQS